jgi:hypothetical protein
VNSQMVLAAATTSRSRLNGVSNTALNEQQLPSHCKLQIANCQQIALSYNYMGVFIKKPTTKTNHTFIFRPFLSREIN